MCDRPKKLNEVISEILENYYKYLDDAHANTICYIAGAMLNIINKLSKRWKNDMSPLEKLKLAASTTKKDAKENYFLSP